MDPNPSITSRLATRRLPVILFIFILLAFVAQSELTQYVQATLGYRQPFFLFYVVHSSFIVMFPLHLIYLVVVTGRSPRYFIAGLRGILIHQLAATSSEALHATHQTHFPIRRLIQLVFLFTAGITSPSLLWFSAVSLASISDVTALWNTNAFFAYIFAVKTFRLQWQPRKLMAVIAATVGATAVVYGGSISTPATPDPEPQETMKTTAIIRIKPTAPLLGDLLTLVASIAYGLYQVLYKKYIALPSDLDSEPIDDYDGIPVSTQDSDGDGDVEETLLTRPLEPVSPSPFGLYANFFTSAIGLCTLAVFWIPLPILNYLDLEPFRLPADMYTVGVIVGVAITGVIFNGGLMILLGIWGPIITSVGNLLTIVLVFISDIIWGGGWEAVTIWSSIGASIIVGAFGVLVYDMGKAG